jgi:folate-dependent phosphoribosylglycinamide formyltransferase PurN
LAVGDNPGMAASVDPRFRVAVLISGGGSTLANLLELSAAGTLRARVCGVVASRNCPGLAYARQAGVPYEVVRRSLQPPEGHADAVTGVRTQDRPALFDPQEFSARVTLALDRWQPQLVVFGGFLSPYIPPPHYRGRVINIHPALLPLFGGQGMYGDRVHQAVLDSRAQFSGATVHYVDDEYDHGAILAQRVVTVLPGDSVAALGARVRQVERELYPEVINWFADGRQAAGTGSLDLAPRDLLQDGPLPPPGL